MSLILAHNRGPFSQSFNKFENSGKKLCLLMFLDLGTMGQIDKWTKGQMDKGMKVQSDKRPRDKQSDGKSKK